MIKAEIPQRNLISIFSKVKHYFLRKKMKVCQNFIKLSLFNQLAKSFFVEK